MDPMTWAAIIGAAVSIAGTLASSAQGTSGGGYTKDARDAARLQQEYASFATNPNHPYTKALTNVITEQMQNDAASALMDEMRLRRRQVAAGNMVAGVDNARRDEANSYTLQRSFIDARKAGLQTAMRQLSAMAGQQGAANTYSNLAGYQNLQQQTNNANMWQGLSNIPSLLTSMYQMYGGSGGTTPAAQYANGSVGSGAGLYNSPMLAQAFSGMLGSP